MVSTTTSKKEIVDFIWEWAEAKGLWALWLVQLVVEREQELSASERQCIFDYFLHSVGLMEVVDAIAPEKPIYTPLTKSVELKSLSNISGVNRLDNHQDMEFASNVTVVYGENGSGKTGYTRVLKSLGISHDPNTSIYSDIFGSNEAKSAAFNFEVDGNACSFDWDGSNKHPDLSNVSIFNNNCVHLSLKDRELIVSPVGFHLFSLVSNELNELEVLLKAKQESFDLDLPWSEFLEPGNVHQQYIQNLSCDSDETILNELCVYNAVHEKQYSDLNESLSKLNRHLIDSELSQLRSFDTEMESVKQKIETTKSKLNISAWEALISFNQQISALERTTQIGIRDIAQVRGVQMYDSKEFHSFLEAAETYLRTLGRSNYPLKDDSCPYCLQPLTQGAHELLKSYSALLNDTTQVSLNNLRTQKRELIATRANVIAQVTFNLSIFGADANGAPIQPKEVVEFNNQLSTCKTDFEKGSIAKGNSFNLKYDSFLALVAKKKSEVEKQITAKVELNSKLSSREEALKKQLASLKDRKLFSSKKAEIVTGISNCKSIKKLGDSSRFNTHSLSVKTSTAREQLVKDDFQRKFEIELKAFRKSSIQVDLTFKTERGNSRIAQRIKNYQLAEILSEGEQKAIALAEFLTELQLDKIRAPVIFDDPVNSLDHRIIDEVAIRLIELSKTRQVIIFTHSILLLNSIIQQSELDTNKQAGVRFKFHRVKANFNKTGVLDQVEEINSYSHYQKKLQDVLQVNPLGQDENKLAAEGYAHLRSMIEVTVEESLLQKVIKRYRKGVAFPSLLRINGHKIDAHKGELNSIYEKCCTSISAHSSPSEIDNPPRLTELETDFEEFKKIRKEFV